MSQLEDLLQQCTVKLTITGRIGWGTGFFVAPGWILTCAHVIQEVKGQAIQVRWQSHENWAQAVVYRSLPASYDLALLRVLFPTDANPPCVYLNEEIRSRDPLYLFGYPDQDFPNGCPVTFYCEGLTGDDPSLIKFALGQVRPGMSGSPLLNQRTGKVCGIVKFTRDRTIDLGGGAIPASIIFQYFPDLQQQNTQFHQQDTRWKNFLVPPCPTVSSNRKGYRNRQADLDKVHSNWTKGLLEQTIYNRAKAKNPYEVIGSPDEEPKKQRRKPTIFQAPSLPSNFVARPEAITTVKDVLLSDIVDQPSTLVISAIYGLGGIGKSVLAEALAHDPDIQSRFADGILWATLGQKPDILSLLSGWIQALGDYNFKPTTIDSASTHLRSLLSTKDKGLLLVVDDLWQAEHFEPFRVGNSNSRLLVTTREAVILDCYRYDLDVMNLEQSLQLLKNTLHQELKPEDVCDVTTLIEAVGYLPLALALLAARIKEGFSWRRLREEFEDEYQRRFKLLQQSNIEGQGTAEAIRNLSLDASFSLSLRRLRETHHELYAYFLWFGILPDDALITEKMALTLWDCSRWDAGDALRTLKAKALLQDGKALGNVPSYRLHDLVHDYARKLLPEPSEGINTSQLPGLGLTLAAAHAELLERYRRKTIDGLWYSLLRDEVNDGYINRHLIWHMVQSHQPDAVHKLLQEETPDGRNGWYTACERLGQTANFVTDVGQAWDMVDDAAAKANLSDDERANVIGLQCRYMLIIASLNCLAELPDEFLLSLVEKGIWTPDQGLAYARQMTVPGSKSYCLSQLAQYFPNNEQALLEEALEVIHQIRNKKHHIESERHRAEVLRWLMGKLPVALLPKVLEAGRQIQDEEYRVEVLTSLIGNEFDFTSSLAGALNGLIRNEFPIQDEEYGTEVLSSLIENEFDFTHSSPFPPKPETDSKVSLWNSGVRRASRYDFFHESPKLPEDLLPKLLEAACQIQNEEYCARVLSKLIGRLPETHLPNVLEAAHQIQNEDYRVSVLSGLAKKQPELLAEVLEATYQVQNENYRADILCWLIRNLPNYLQFEIVDAVRHIQNEKLRVKVLRELSRLAERLPEALLTEILGTIRQVENVGYRATLLSCLVKKLPEDRISEVLEDIYHIQDRFNRVKVLCELVGEHHELLPEILGSIPHIEHKLYFSMVMERVVENLPEELLPGVVKATRCIQDPTLRSQILRDLYKKLPELLPEALESIYETQDEGLLVELIEKLPTDVLPKILKTVHQIQSEKGRVKVINELVTRLPEISLAEVLETSYQIQAESCRVEVLDRLIGRLPESLISKLLEATHQIQDEYERHKVLTRLARKSPEHLLPQIFEAGLQIQSGLSRLEVMNALVERLPEFLLPKVLDSIRQVQEKNSWWYAKALGVLGKRLPELLPEALEAICHIQDEELRAGSLIDLIKELPNELLLNALEVIGQIHSEKHRSRALEIIIGKLPTDLLPMALEIAHQIQDEYYRAQFVSELMKKLPKLLPEDLKIVHRFTRNYTRAIVLQRLGESFPELLPDAIEAACQVQDSYHRTELLSELAEILPNTLVPEFLRIICSNQSGLSRMKVLSSLGEKLPKSFWPELLETASQICEESTLDRSLIKIVGNLPKTLLPQALQTARQIKDELYRAKVLSNLLGKLPEILPKILDTVHQMEWAISRFEILGILIESLPDLLPEALATASQIQDESQRSTALGILAEHISRILLPETLEITRQIKNEKYRIETLSALGNRFPEILPEALKAANQIEDEKERAEILSELAHKLPEVLPEALETTRQIEPAWYRAKPLTILLKASANSADKQILHQNYRAILRLLGTCYRPSVLHALASSPTLVEKIGGEPALRAVLQSTNLVCRWWP